VPIILYDDLEAALQWVSSSAPFENAAYISKTTGKVFYSSGSGDIEGELPDDYEDAALYWTVPHKNDLDLGSRLAHRFTDERLPEHRREVHDIFRQRGAYSKFKALLQRLRILDAWFAFERAETESALLAWAEEEGMSVELRRTKPGA
jgi:hypothetical protein